jgi:hypothetical protein
MRKVIKDYIREVLPLNYFASNSPSKILPNVILVWGFAPEQTANKKICTQKGFGICPYLRSPAADYFIHHGGDLDKLIKKHKKKIRKLKKFEKSDVDTIIEEAKAISNHIDLIYKKHLNRLRLEKINTDF